MSANCLGIGHDGTRRREAGDLFAQIRYKERVLVGLLRGLRRRAKGRSFAAASHVWMEGVRVQEGSRALWLSTPECQDKKPHGRVRVLLGDDRSNTKSPFPA